MLIRQWPLYLLLALLSFGATNSLFADDADPSEAAEAAAPANDEATAEEEDPLAIPEDASADELLKFIERAATLRQAASSREEFIANITKAQQAVAEAATRVLNKEDVTDEQAVEAVTAKINALRLLSRIGDDKAADELAKFTESLKDDPRPAIAKMMELQTLMAAAANLPRADQQQRQAFVTELKEYLSGKEEFSREDLMLAMSAGQALEQAQANEQAADLYQEIAKLAAASDDAQIKSYGKRFEGMARRVNLLGSKMDVFGPTLDGEELKWENYRGKVVLIDFWATWCGPCIAELPNLKDNYKIYHSRGFDVVGVSLDNDRAKLDEFIEKHEIAWANIYDSDSNGWENPLAQYYGISGIPTAILVDKEGKVVSLNARGEMLGELLEKLIGPANETVDGDTEPQPENEADKE